MVLTVLSFLASLARPLSKRSRRVSGVLLLSLITLGAMASCKTQSPSELFASDSGAASVALPSAAPTSPPKIGTPTQLPLAFTSRTVELKLAFGESRSEEVRLMGKLAAAAKLSVLSIDPPGPVVTILPAQGSLPQGVRVTVVGTEVGQRAGQVSLATGVDEPKELTVLYSWKVVGNLTVDPTNPFLDLRAPPPVEVVVRVTSSRKDFRLDRVQVVDGPFHAMVAPDEVPGGAAIHVTVAESAPNDESRGALGTLRLFSNDPAEPRKDVPIFALGPISRGAPPR